MNISWNAEKYEDSFSFVHRYGEDVLNLIAMPDASDTLPFAADFGCGTGELTEKLAKMGFTVLGVDDSEKMIDAAKENHPDLDFQKGNVIDFSLPRKADVIFSNAVFHWIDASKQEALAQNIYNNLKHGGQLVCEFGGKGCAEAVHSTLDIIFGEAGRIYPRVFWFPTIEEYSAILEKVGFRVEAAFLFDRPTPQKGEHGLRNWINMFVKIPFEGIGKQEKENITAETEKRLAKILLKDGKWFIDYVRIRVKAVKL